MIPQAGDSNREVDHVDGHKHFRRLLRVLQRCGDEEPERVIPLDFLVALHQCFDRTFDLELRVEDVVQFRRDVFRHILNQDPLALLDRILQFRRQLDVIVLAHHEVFFHDHRAHALDEVVGLQLGVDA